MDLKAVKHIASLARIELTEKEAEKMVDQLSSVLDFVRQLDKVNTDGVEPLYQTSGIINSTRSDEHRGDFKMDSNLNEKLIGQAPAKDERFIKVKPILSR